VVTPVSILGAKPRFSARGGGRVEHLTGLSVGKITIEISWLNPSSHVRKSLK